MRARVGRRFGTAGFDCASAGRGGWGAYALAVGLLASELLGKGPLSPAGGQARAAVSPCGPATPLVVARHAERDGSADALSPRGAARAAELLHAVEKLNLAAIYHSDTGRARDTGEPLAVALGLSPNVYPAPATSALAQEILLRHAGATTLVIGHSNTVPAIIAAAGGPELPNIDEAEFDDLFVLTVSPSCPDNNRLVHLQYGEPSP